MLFILFAQDVIEYIFSFGEWIPVTVFILCGVGLVFCIIQTIVIVYLECKKNKKKKEDK